MLHGGMFHVLCKLAVLVEAEVLTEIAAGYSETEVVVDLVPLPTVIHAAPFPPMGMYRRSYCHWLTSQTS